MMSSLDNGIAVCLRRGSVFLSVALIAIGIMALAANGCGSDPQDPTEAATEVELTPLQDYDIGDRIYVSPEGFEVFSVPGRDDVLGVQFCAARTILEAGEFGEPMTIGAAAEMLDDEDPVRVGFHLLFFYRIDDAHFENYGTAFPELVTFFADVFGTDEGDDDDPPPCPNCSMCNEPPCEELTMYCLKQCYLPTGG